MKSHPRVRGLKYSYSVSVSFTLSRNMGAWINVTRPRCHAANVAAQVRGLKMFINSNLGIFVAPARVRDSLR